MKQKVQERNSHVQDVTLDNLAVTVQDKKLLALHNLINCRKRITKKIKQLPDLGARLKVEKPKLLFQQLVDRLLKKKTAVDKAIAKYDGVSIPGRPAHRIPKPFSVKYFKERCHMTLEEILDAQVSQLRGDLRGIFQQSACPTINGRATPYLTQIASMVPELNDLNHDSSADYAVCQQSYYMGCLGYLIGAWLNDDASIWRDDNPDSVMWYDNVCVYVAPLECDSNIVASLSMRFSGEIVSEADDHNEIRQYVYVAHSDENGNLPPYVSFGDEYNLNSLDLSGEIGLPSGNRFDSGWITAVMSFKVKGGVASKVAIANCTELCAQDGSLNIVGTWEITDLCYTATPI